MCHSKTRYRSLSFHYFSYLPWELRRYLNSQLVYGNLLALLKMAVPFNFWLLSSTLSSHAGSLSHHRVLCLCFSLGMFSVPVSQLASYIHEKKKKKHCVFFWSLKYQSTFTTFKSFNGAYCILIWVGICMHRQIHQSRIPRDGYESDRSVISETKYTLK